LSDVQGDQAGLPGSYPEYLDWKERGGQVFSELGAWFQAGASLTGAGDPERIFGERMSANLPGLLGVAPLLGRGFQPSDDLPSSDRVVMVSEGLWRRRFGSDPAILGRALSLNGIAHTVIGVFPATPGARLPNELASGRTTDYWAPLRLTPENAPRGLHLMFVVGRLRDGVNLPQARSEVAALAAALRADNVTTHGVTIVPVQERVIGNVGPLLSLLVAAVAMLLLIACANVANLLLARAALRQREFAVRVALGAGRARIVTQLLAESVTRAVLGGALGIALAYAGAAAMRAWLTIRLPRFEEVGIDGRVLAFSLLLSVLTGLGFGLVPGLRASRGDPRQSLHEGGRGMFGSIRKDRFRRALSVGEVALSFILLVGAGLLIQSFGRLLAQPLGFDPDRIVTAYTTLPASGYPDSTAQREFFRRELEAVSVLPGVQAAALASNLPVEGGVNGDVGIEGKEFPDGESPAAEKRVVSTNYFQVIGARLIAGRLLEVRDAAGAAPVVVVNQSFARRWLPQEDPIGKRVSFSWGTQGFQTIVGVIEDLREGALNQPNNPAVYIPVEQRGSDGMYLLVRSAVRPTDLMVVVRRTIAGIDPNLPVSEVRTLSDVIRADVASQSLSASILGTFAALALILAAVGLYGVILFSVVQRTQELGIRAALGAQRRDLMGLVMRQGAGFVVAGILLGLGGALALTRLLTSQLYGVEPHDPATFALVAVLLTGVTMAAVAVPAMRATRADPLQVLRQE
jgi:putative ABC transport system permease protein